MNYELDIFKLSNIFTMKQALGRSLKDATTQSKGNFRISHSLRGKKKIICKLNNQCSSFSACSLGGVKKKFKKKGKGLVTTRRSKLENQNMNLQKQDATELQNFPFQ